MNRVLPILACVALACSAKTLDRPRGDHAGDRAGDAARGDANRAGDTAGGDLRGPGDNPSAGDIQGGDIAGDYDCACPPGSCGSQTFNCGGGVVFGWCGPCPQCAAIRAAIDAEVASLQACAPSDTCIHDPTGAGTNYLCCGYYRRDNADLTQLDNLVSDYQLNNCEAPISCLCIAPNPPACVAGMCQGT